MRYMFIIIIFLFFIQAAFGDEKVKDTTSDTNKAYFLLKGLKPGSRVFIDGMEVKPKEGTKKYGAVPGSHAIHIELQYFLDIEKEASLAAGETNEIEIKYTFDNKSFKQSYKPVAVGILSVGGAIFVTGLPFFIVSVTDYFGYQTNTAIRNRQLAFFCMGMAMELAGLTMTIMSVPLFITNKNRDMKNDLDLKLTFNMECRNGIAFDFRLALK
jgi:hypothetical protein